MSKSAPKTKASAKVIRSKAESSRTVARGKGPVMKARATTTAKAKKRAPSAAAINRQELEALRRRDELIAQYMPYATSIANRVSQTLSASVDYNDVVCNARLGLLEAAKKYDSKQEVDFRTFAYYRIKGAIYDGLRKTGWLPRTLYARMKFEEASNDYLKHVSETTHGSPTETDVVGAVNNLASIYVMSIDANDDIEIEDHAAVDSEENASMGQIRDFMREAVNDLPEKEKMLVKMYYFQNKTLEEAGEKLKLSKSWASRLHARALELLLRKIRELTQKAERGEDVLLTGAEEILP